MAGITLASEYAVVLWVIGGVLTLVAIAMGIKWYAWPFFTTIRIVRIPSNQELEYGASTKEEHEQITTATPIGSDITTLLLGTQRNLAEFYINREDLRRAKGNLADELRGMKKIWAAWHTGGSVLDNNDLLDPSVNPREFILILTDPEDDYMIDKMEPRGKEGKGYWKGQIQRTAAQAHRLGSVHFYQGPIGDAVLIADPKCLKGDRFSIDAWARIDTTIPFRLSLRHSSYRVTHRDAPRQFEAIVDHYRTLLGRATPYGGEYDQLST